MYHSFSFFFFFSFFPFPLLCLFSFSDDITGERRPGSWRSQPALPLCHSFLPLGVRIQRSCSKVGERRMGVCVRRKRV